MSGNLHITPQLINQLNHGDEHAFNTIYQHYIQRLYFFALRFVTEADAKDVVSEAFIGLWEKRTDFHHISALQHYLFVTIRNRCLNILKQEQVHLKHQQALVHQLEKAAEHELDLEKLTGELVRYVYEKVEQLPPRQKEIFLLSFRDGLKPAQIAEQLNLSVQTVNNQKLTVLKMLRGALANRPHLLGLLLFLLAEK